jgi:integrase/recombinase XerD
VTDGDRALVDRFCDMMAAEAGAARNTLLAYRADLAAAAAAVGSLEGADADALRTLGPAWSALAASTVARRSASLRRFYGFLFDEVGPIYLFHAINALRATGQDYLARMIAAEALART